MITTRVTIVTDLLVGLRVNVGRRDKDTKLAVSQPGDQAAGPADADTIRGLVALCLQRKLDRDRIFPRADTVRRWISRFNCEGLAGLADRPRSGRPPLGGRRLAGRIAALLGRPGPWTLPRIRRYLGWPQISARTLYRRVRLVAIWRRPKLTARGDPDHDHVVAGIVVRLLELPRQSMVLAEDETHLNLLPDVRASWTLRGARPKVLTRARTGRSPCSARSS
jgi:hypothetical protein